MLFTSPIFLLVFFPLVLVLNGIIKGSIRNVLLLILSLLFYAWGEPVYVLLMIASIVINYSCAIVIGKSKKNSKTAMAFGISLNLLLLLFFKYFNFAAENANILIKVIRGGIYPFPKVLLPIGISFYTFQGMSYIIDVYKQKVKSQKSFVCVALYISMFPQLIAGPIVRYSDIEEKIMNRTTSLERYGQGLKRFMIGFSKKMILANTTGLIADKVFVYSPDLISSPVAWLGAICYALQIFFDFSAYSDMAIGIGKILGFDFKENFNYPYVSKNIREFWRRWHISLSTWFKDYLYIPLGGNRTGHTYRNLMIVFLLCGFWHGASWTFVVWGAYHGLFLILERTKFGKVIDKLPKPLTSLYALLVVLVGWVFFRADTLGYALGYLKTMFSFSMIAVSTDIKSILNLTTLPIVIISIFMCMPIKEYLLGYFKKHTLSYKAIKYTIDVILVISFIVSIFMVAISGYNPFIYFRF